MQYHILCISHLLLIVENNLSRIRRKPDFCLCENKGADQLRSNCEADQRLCFRHSDSTIPVLLKSEISSCLPLSVTVQADLCRTWSETPKTGFLASRLILSVIRSQTQTLASIIKSTPAVLRTEAFFQKVE